LRETLWSKLPVVGIQNMVYCLQKYNMRDKQ